MKSGIFYILLLFFSTVFGQEKKLDLGNFSGINVSNGITVNLSKSSENKALVTGTNRENIILQVVDNILFVKANRINFPKDDNTLVQIFYKDIEEVEAGRGSSLEFCGKLIRDHVKFHIAEGANLFANMDVGNLSANASTGGKIMIIGKADTQAITVKSEGKFSGENLMGSNITIDIEQGGNANIFSRKSVKARIRAGGHIYIYGNPKQIVEEIAYGGTIKKIN